MKTSDKKESLHLEYFGAGTLAFVTAMAHEMKPCNVTNYHVEQVQMNNLARAEMVLAIQPKKTNYYSSASRWMDAPVFGMEMAHGKKVVRMKCFLGVALQEVTSPAPLTHGERYHATKLSMRQMRAERPILDSSPLKHVCAMASYSVGRSHLEGVFVGLQAQPGWKQLRAELLRLATQLPCAPGRVSATRFFAFSGQMWDY